jgi:hypothetical protein
LTVLPPVVNCLWGAGAAASVLCFAVLLGLDVHCLMMSSLPHLTRPWWSRGLEYVGDDYYKRQRLGLQQQHPATNINGRA